MDELSIKLNNISTQYYSQRCFKSSEYHRVEYTIAPGNKFPIDVIASDLGVTKRHLIIMNKLSANITANELANETLVYFKKRK